jgi:hypothetical protein
MDVGRRLKRPSVSLAADTPMTKSSLKTLIGAGEMAHWVTCLSHKHEDLSLIPRTCIIKWHTGMSLQSQLWKGKDWRFTGDSWLAILVWSVNSRPHWKNLSQKKPGQRVLMKSIQSWFLVCMCIYKNSHTHLHANVHTYTNTLLHTSIHEKEKH